MANRTTTLAAPSPMITLDGWGGEWDSGVESGCLDDDDDDDVDVDAETDPDPDPDPEAVVERDPDTDVVNVDADSHAGPVEAGFGLAVRAQSPSLAPHTSNLPSQHHFHSCARELRVLHACLALENGRGAHPCYFPPCLCTLTGPGLSRRSLTDAGPSIGCCGVSGRSLHTQGGGGEETLTMR